MQKLAGAFVDDLFDPTKHSRFPTAIPGHLRVEAQTPVLKVGVESSHDLGLGLDPHALTWPQIGATCRRLCCRSPQEAPAQAATETQSFGEDSRTQRLISVEQADQDCPEDGQDTDVATSDVLNVLAHVAEWEKLRGGPRELGDLACEALLAGGSRGFARVDVEVSDRRAAVGRCRSASGRQSVGPVIDSLEPSLL